MNRRNFFKVAGAVMVGGLVGAQVQVSAEPDIEALARAREAEWERQALEAYDQYWEALVAEHKRITTPPSLSPYDIAADVRQEFLNTLLEAAA